MATSPHPDLERDSALSDIEYHEAEGLAVTPEAEKRASAPRVENGRRRAGRAQPRPAGRLRVRHPRLRRHHHGRHAARRPPRAQRPRRRSKAPDPGRRQGHRLREVRQGRPDAAGRARRRRQEVHRRRPAARDAGRSRTSRRPRRGATPSTARPTAAPPPARRSSSTRATRSQVTFVNGGSKAMAVNMAALDRLPLRRGRAEQELHRRRPRQEADDRLRRRAPRRVHVPLRHAAGPHAHQRGHDGHDGRQAAQPARRSTGSCG